MLSGTGLECLGTLHECGHAVTSFLSLLFPSAWRSLAFIGCRFCSCASCLCRVVVHRRAHQSTLWIVDIWSFLVFFYPYAGRTVVSRMSVLCTQKSFCWVVLTSGIAWSLGVPFCCVSQQHQSVFGSGCTSLYSRQPRRSHSFPGSASSHRLILYDYSSVCTTCVGEMLSLHEQQFVTVNIYLWKGLRLLSIVWDGATENVSLDPQHLCDLGACQKCKNLQFNFRCTESKSAFYKDPPFLTQGVKAP